MMSLLELEMVIQKKMQHEQSKPRASRCVEFVLRTIGLLLLGLAINVPNASANYLATGPSFSNIVANAITIPLYSKYEVKFDLATASSYSFFQYDSAPPPGIAPGIGVTAQAIITTPSGKTLRQPAFYMTETQRIGSGASMYFVETAKKYWAVRFAPEEIGTYQVTLSAQDASGAATANVGAFTSIASSNHGFIHVSKSDSRYFEFSDGSLYFPIGPAWAENQSTNPNARAYDYSQYVGTGQNLERPWMGGAGAYSTNWARWKSSAEQGGNEGIMTRLAFDNGTGEKVYPGHDLSYEIFYSATAPNGFRMWLTGWMDDMFFTKIKPNATYQLKLTYKAVNIAGPRNSAYPYGFVIKPHRGVNDWIGPNDDIETILRNMRSVVGYLPSSNGWQTIIQNVTINSQEGGDISLYLDNVSAGQVYIDEFSLHEILPGGVLGGEVVRNPVADEHTYVEQRPAAFFDWQVQQGEQNGVYFKFVVHDKNDWIQNHLLDNGQWTSISNGYFSNENTKARWLLKQWYRYLVARWGYSTAIHSWEQANETNPNDTQARIGANAFAGYMHTFGANSHMATTSFWCCSLKDGLGTWNSATYPNIDYVDLHEYSGNSQTAGSDTLGTDMAAWSKAISDYAVGLNLGKPLIWAENGISQPKNVPPGDWWSGLPDLRTPNPGIWYHNLLWSQLGISGLSAPNYWFGGHFRSINREAISQPFAAFVSTLNINRGGYVDAKANVSNGKLRAWGQKNIGLQKAHLWIQNADHTWRNVMNNVSSSQGGTIALAMPAGNYTVTWINTYTGQTIKTETLASNGTLVLTVTGLVDDTAVKIDRFTVNGANLSYLPLIRR